MNKNNSHTSSGIILKFVREKVDGDIVLFINGKVFKSNDYIEIIKNITNKEKLLEPQFDGEFSDTEKEKIRDMVQKIHEIGSVNLEKDENDKVKDMESEHDDIDSDNISF